MGVARVAWMLRLVETGADGDGWSTDVMEIAKSADLRDIATLGLSLAEAKQVLAALQREVVAAQAREHALRRPTCRACGGACHLKDYRPHRIATLFGRHEGELRHAIPLAKTAAALRRIRFASSRRFTSRFSRNVSVTL